MVEENLTEEQKLLNRIGEIDQALFDVYRGQFQYSKSKQYSALSLKCQRDLVDVIIEANWRSKQAKIELKTVESEVGIYYRNNKTSDKKPPESAIQDLVNADEKVKQAKKDLIDAEKQYEKLDYYMDILKEAHIFFRNLDKDNV